LPQPPTSGLSLLKTGGTLLTVVALSAQLLSTPVIAAEQQPGQSSNATNSFDERSVVDL